MPPLAEPSRPAFACASTKACIGSGRQIFDGPSSPTSLAETILTLLWVQNFINISRVVIWSGHTGSYEDRALLFGK